MIVQANSIQYKFVGENEIWLLSLLNFLYMYDTTK